MYGPVPPETVRSISPSESPKQLASVITWVNVIGAGSVIRIFGSKWGLQPFGRPVFGSIGVTKTL